MLISSNSTFDKSQIYYLENWLKFEDKSQDISLILSGNNISNFIIGNTFLNITTLKLNENNISMVILYKKYYIYIV